MKKHLLKIMAALAIAILLIITGCEADPVSVSSISLNKTELNLALGSEEKLTATTSPSDATVGTGITWSSDKAEIASVDKDGNVTANAVGEATITATSDNGIKATCKITVKPIVATSIQLSAETLTLEKNGTADLTVIFTPTNTTDKTVTWSSDSPTIAKVENGKVTALATGTAKITAKTANNLEASCTITVKKVPANSITLSKAETELLIGTTETLTVTFDPTDTTDKTITWESSLPAVATVENGKITALTVGETVITATTVNGKEAKCTVKVNPITAKGITLNKSTMDIFIGSEETLTVTFDPTNTTDQTITWESSKPAVASVEKGKITALTVGETTITAKTANDKTATCTVTVKPIIATGISFEKSTITSEKTADPFKVDVVFTPSNTTDKSVSWASSKQEVATVSPEGLISPVATGTTVIKAVHGKFEAEFTLEIVDVINEAGKLSKTITDKKLESTASLRISGSLNDKDFEVIKTLADLKTLDLKLTNITALPTYDKLNPGLENIILPATITLLSGYQFFGIPLKSIELQEGLTTIGEYAFYTTNISTITIPGSVTSFGNYPFYQCALLTTINFNEGITEIPAWILSENPAVTSISLPSTLTTIGAGAFSGTGITEITIPASVTTIGESALQECLNLTTLNIGEGVTAIPDNMCWHATNLDSVTFKGNKLNSIGNWAFDSTALTSVKIPNSVTTIGEAAFQNCTALETLDLSTELTAIPNFMCYGAKSLRVINVPDSVTTIGKSAFYNCIALTNVTIGKNVETIGDYAFDAFDETNPKVECAVNTLNFSESNKKITKIGKSAFRNAKITQLDIPDSVTTIDDNAFEGCINLISLKLPANLETVGNNAFINCTALPSLVLPNTIKTIGNKAFAQCENIVFENGILTMPSQLTEIGNDAFGKNESVKTLVLNNQLTTIHQGAFLWLNAIKSLTIPESVTLMTDEWPTAIDSITFEGLQPPAMELSKMTGDPSGKLQPPNRTWMTTAIVNVPVGSEETYKNSTWFKGDQYKETHGSQHIPCFDPANVNKK